MSRVKILALIMVLLISGKLFSQGLFENPDGQDGEGVTSLVTYDLSGYDRGTVYFGEMQRSGKAEMKSGYGEAALKLKAGQREWGNLFTEIRFRTGYEYNDPIHDVELREAYVAFTPGRFNLRIGQQIIAWGRADAFNPTNAITPQNYFVRSPEPDDMRMGNFLFRGQCMITNQIRLEGIWVPRYKYSVYRFDLFDIPDYVDFSEGRLTDNTLKQGNLAGKIEFILHGLDGSLSYFNGFDPLPGIDYTSLPENPEIPFQLEMFPQAFRQHTLGMDFSTTIASYGLRGEAAYRVPAGEYRGKIYSPNKDIRYVFGLDRSFGDLNLMVQYSGQYVFNYADMPPLTGIPDFDPALLQDPSMITMVQGMMMEQVKGFNRVTYGQTEEFSHILSIRPSISLLHQNMNIELFSLYNFSTEEYNIYPKLTYRFSGGLSLTAGGQYFAGPENTLYDQVGLVFNGGFLELRMVF